MNREFPIPTANINTVPESPFGDAGYSLGVSACYAGRIGDMLIMAGGCNFPVPGQKKYYDKIYAAKIGKTSLEWNLIGTLPVPVAYGYTVSTGDSLIFIGGSNENGSMSNVISIHLSEENKAIIKNLHSLPYPVDNMSGAFCGDKVYIVGGNQNNKPSASILCLDIKDGHKWIEVGTIPGAPRVQTVCAAFDSNLYIWGGFYANGEESHVATDGYVFELETKRFYHVDAPRDSDGNEVTLSGGIATTYYHDSANPLIICTGGVNKDIFLDAISGRYQLVEKENYMKQSPEWYKFNGILFAFNPLTNKWTRLIPQSRTKLSRAGAVFVNSNNGLYYIGGELKPGVRTPEILHINFNNLK